MPSPPSEQEALGFNFAGILAEDSSELIAVIEAMELKIVNKYANMVDGARVTSAVSSPLKAFNVEARHIVADTVVQATDTVRATMLDAAHTRMLVYEAAGLTIPAAVNMSKVVISTATLPLAMTLHKSKLNAAAHAAALNALAKDGSTRQFKEEYRRLVAIEVRNMQGTQTTAGRAAATYAEGEVAKKNPKVMAFKRWNATLERTCVRCYAYHGVVYPATGGPFMPLHPYCACFYTFYPTMPSQEADATRKFTRLPEAELGKMIGKTLASAVERGIIRISDVVKPITDKNGYIIDVSVKRLSDFPALKNK